MGSETTAGNAFRTAPNAGSARGSMHSQPKILRPLWLGAALVFCCSSFSAQTPAKKSSKVHDVVLVHGAWADGSGWRGVYDILVKDGFNVTIVQEPETTFKEDVAATKRALALQDGPCILVAHSYGGAVITEAGNEANVAGLVYIAAHMPDAGENEADDGKRFPSDLSKSGGIQKTPDGFTHLDPKLFREYFAADLSAEQAAFLSRTRKFLILETTSKPPSPQQPGKPNQVGCW